MADNVKIGKQPLKRWLTRTLPFVLNVLLIVQVFHQSSTLGGMNTNQQSLWSFTSQPNTSQGSNQQEPLLLFTLQPNASKGSIPSFCTNGLVPTTNNTNVVDSLCQCVSYWTHGRSQSTATSLWNLEYVKERLHLAVQASFQDCYQQDGFDTTILTNLIDRMLHLLNSHQLKRSIKTRANPFVMERVLEVILRRLRDPDQNPPLRIAVFGGSVTQGVLSEFNNLNVTRQNDTDWNPCAWSMKLERLLNHLLQPTYYSETAPNVVEVKNLGMGGSDSIMGTTLLEFNFLGEDMGIYDIIISSFGANDLQAPNGLERDMTYISMQRFMRLAKAQRPCNDLPLVVQIDDVNEYNKRTVRDGLRYSREMTETNNWAGFMSLSYPDAVRDEFTADPLHSILHALNLHPGFNFHTGMSWTIAYNLLEASLEACDASSLPKHNSPEPRGGLPLPLLSDGLLGKDVPGLRDQQSKEHTHLCEKNTTGTSCAWRYIAHKLGAGTKEEVHQTISRVSTNIEGWKGMGWPIRKPRRTWSASKKGASFTIQLDNLKIPINKLLVLYLKSYGEEWEATRLQILVEGKLHKNNNGDDAWTELKRVELTGFHRSKTSINYSEHVELGDSLKEGDSVRATFTLIAGDRFQINGLAFCHSESLLEI